MCGGLKVVRGSRWVCAETCEHMMSHMFNSLHRFPTLTTARRDLFSSFALTARRTSCSSRSSSSPKGVGVVEVRVGIEVKTWHVLRRDQDGIWGLR